MKNLLLPAILFLSVNCIAQVGINTSSPDKDSDLTLASDNKGLLLNKVSLTSTASPAPLSAHVAGMTIYNNATIADVIPGVYYNDGSKWIRPNTSASWNLDGNFVDTQAFLGTINTEALRFRYNNLNAGRLHTDYTSYGVGTGISLNGLAIGANALASSANTPANVAVGAYALNKATTGGFNVSVGTQSSNDLTTGSQNVAVGQRALLHTTTGSENTVLGSDALRSSLTSSLNVAIGRQSAQDLITGNLNTVIGAGSFQDLTNYNHIVAVGANSGTNSVNAFNTRLQTYNTYIGSSTGTDNTTDNPLQYATAIGAEAVVSSSNSIVLGRKTGADKVGIGVSGPTNQLHIRASSATSNPVRIEGLQPGSVTDKIIVLDATGVLKSTDPASLLRSPNGNCFKLSVDNAGALSTAPTVCP